MLHKEVVVFIEDAAATDDDGGVYKYVQLWLFETWYTNTKKYRMEVNILFKKDNY